MNHRKKLIRIFTYCMVFIILLFILSFVGMFAIHHYQIRYWRIVGVFAWLTAGFCGVSLALTANTALDFHSDHPDFFLDYDELVKLKNEEEELVHKLRSDYEVIGKHEALKLIDVQDVKDLTK